MHAVFRNGAQVARWFGQGLCALCCLAAIVVLIHTRFSINGQTCAAALLLLGVLSLAGGHWLWRLASRRRRRHRTTIAHNSVEIY